nr:Tripartite terminase [Ipomoea batatas]
MAVKEPEFLLPPEFFTADDILAGYAGTFEKTAVKTTKLDPDLCFPAEFPYDLCSSPAASTGTESDEEEFLAELTRRLTRSSLDETRKSTSPAQNHFESWLLCGSPQSTLARVGSWSGMSAGSGSPNGSSQISSPTTPLAAKNDAWDLILQAAAGQVARLKMRAGDELPGTRTFAPLPPHAAVHNARLQKPVGAQMVKQQQGCGSAMWDNGCYIEPPPLFQARASRAAVLGGAVPFVENGRYGRPLVGGGAAGRAAALRSLHFQHQTRSGRPAMPFGGSAAAGGVSGAFGVKKERSGTGVFLPRKYGNNNKPIDSGNKTGCCNPTAKLVHGLHKNNIEDINGAVQPRLNGVFLSDYEMLIARRNAAVLAQQRMNFRQERHEDWTFEAFKGVENDGMKLMDKLGLSADKLKHWAYFKKVKRRELQKLITFDWQHVGLDEIRDGEVSPQGRSADCTEIVNRQTQISTDFQRDFKQIGDQTSERRPGIASPGYEFPQERLADFNQGIKHLCELFLGTRAIPMNSGGEGVEAEAGAEPAGVDVGVR